MREILSPRSHSSEEEEVGLKLRSSDLKVTKLETPVFVCGVGFAADLPRSPEIHLISWDPLRQAALLLVKPVEGRWVILLWRHVYLSASLLHMPLTLFSTQNIRVCAPDGDALSLAHHLPGPVPGWHGTGPRACVGQVDMLPKRLQEAYLCYTCLLKEVALRQMDMEAQIWRHLQEAEKGIWAHTLLFSYPSLICSHPLTDRPSCAMPGFRSGMLLEWPYGTKFHLCNHSPRFHKTHRHGKVWESMLLGIWPQ